MEPEDLFIGNSDIVRIIQISSVGVFTAQLQPLSVQRLTVNQLTPNLQSIMSYTDAFLAALLTFPAQETT